MEWFDTTEEKNTLRHLENKTFLHTASPEEIKEYLALRDAKDTWTVAQPWFTDSQAIRREISGWPAAG